jgi:hypothetical protein
VRKKMYYPVTPAGSVLMHLLSKTRAVAIERLMREAAHMPYKTWGDFQRRGYTIETLEPEEGEAA